MTTPLRRDDVFSGAYGSRNCFNCRRPFAEHLNTSLGGDQHCPRGTVPPHVRELWASFGTRTQLHASHDGCPCGQCTHG